MQLRTEVHDRLATLARLLETRDGTEQSSPSLRSISRRGFLQAAQSLPALLYFGQMNAATASVIINDQQVWQIDASWLAGRPTLSHSRRGNVLVVQLTGSLYPGTDLPADFEATLHGLDQSADIVFQSTNWTEPRRVNLHDWLTGTARLCMERVRRGVSVIDAGDLRVESPNFFDMEIRPTLEAYLRSSRGWTIAENVPTKIPAANEHT